MKLTSIFSKTRTRLSGRIHDSIVVTPERDLDSINSVPEMPVQSRKHLWKITVLTAIFLLVTGLVIVIVINKNNEDSKANKSHANSFCSGEFGGDAGKQAAGILTQDKSEELAKLVEKILASNYIKNTSCLAILTTYYINIYDKTNTQKFLDILRQRNPPGVIFVDDKQIVMSEILARSELLNAQLNKKQNIIGGVDE